MGFENDFLNKVMKRIMSIRVHQERASTLKLVEFNRGNV